MARSLGRFELHQILTGEFALDGGAMFGVVPKVLWQQFHPADDKNRIGLALRSLLIKGDGRCILVDAGLGQALDSKQAAHWGVQPRPGGWAEQLAPAGIGPEDVTDVILTHLHVDHCGGVSAEGPALAFPRATYHVQRRHWEWAQQPSARDAGSFRPEVIAGLARGDRLHLLEGPGELFPGIRLRLSEGHTPAMQLVEVVDGTSSLLYCADLVPTSTHLRVAWHMAYDLFPLTLIEEKRAVVAEALRRQTILFFEHDLVLPACTIKKESDSILVDQVVHF